jgi:glycolate oxidase FAD binding subunit
MSAVACATGLMTVSMKPATEAVMTIIARLRTRVGSAGGSVVALHVPDALRGRIDVWGPDPDALPLMREIKRRFDPGRILNPGRFVGSI